jgi:indole-3-glycerol phosphate synthase
LFKHDNGTTGMSKFIRSGRLEELVKNSYKSIDDGYYSTDKYDLKTHGSISLKKAIFSSQHASIIAEVKYTSPSKGWIVGNKQVKPVELASSMVRAGAAALSVLTQPYLFEGSIEHLNSIRKITNVPLLMKDIIVSETQIEAAKKCGADIILLIKTIFDRNLTEGSIEKFVEYSRKKDLQVLLEVHTEEEFKEILKSSIVTDRLIGINNRNLDSLSVDIKITEMLLNKYDKGKNIVISESGIVTPGDIRYLKGAGADAFLIGTSIMESNDPRSKLTELYLSL